MSTELTELVEAFSLREVRSAPYTPQTLAMELSQALQSILRTLDQITSKFVDIDTSFKEIDEVQAQQFEQDISLFQMPELEQDLFDLYRELNLYLIIKDRFGEAADWNLKVEFEGRLALTYQRSLRNLDKISFK